MTAKRYKVVQDDFYHLVPLNTLINIIFSTTVQEVQEDYNFLL